MQALSKLFKASERGPESSAIDDIEKLIQSFNFSKKNFEFMQAPLKTSLDTEREAPESLILLRTQRKVKQSKA